MTGKTSELSFEKQKKINKHFNGDKQAKTFATIV